MAAARQRAFNGRPTASGSRNAAIAAVQINWKKMSPDGDRDERLEWISEYLGREVRSLTDLTDQQLGAVAGEMKRLTGRQTAVGSQQNAEARTSVRADHSTSANVVNGNFDRVPDNDQRTTIDDRSTIHLASHEQVFTLGKIAGHLAWPDADLSSFLKKRFKCDKFRMLTFHQATSATNMLLKIAAHRDLKKRNGADIPVSRKVLNKYIPLLKAELRIDQKPR